jgi:prefoldin subunit 5
MLPQMKNKGLILVLLIVAAGLGVALIVVNNRAADERREASVSLDVQSNTVVSVKKTLAELQAVNQTLETNIAALRTDYSNKLALSDANLQGTEAALEKFKAEAKAETKAQADTDAAAMAERDKKIADLESQNQDLDKQAADLRLAITNLQAQITLTQSKLDKSEGNRDLLVQELKNLRAAKEDLEKRFDTIADLRMQLRKLKTDDVIARRLDWMRRGVSASVVEKGGQRLIHPPPPSSSAAGSSANVELGPNGAVKIQENPATNAPPK